VGLGKNYDGQDCSLARALEIVGERWTMLVLRDCFFGVRRFTDLQAHLDVPRAVLTERLERLVAEGLLARVEYQRGRHEYTLTDRGLDLWPALYALAQWGERHRAPNGRRRIFTHAPCDTPVEPTGFCPACGVVPGPAELDLNPGPGMRAVRDDPVSVALRTRHRLLTPVGQEHRP
jgi:DNA-binding HxlR family transcriptional regulator